MVFYSKLKNLKAQHELSKKNARPITRNETLHFYKQIALIFATIVFIQIMELIDRG